MLDFLYNFFSSMGFNEPLHPPITHMPIGLTVGALSFLAVALIFKKKQLEITARHVSILAFIFAFPTILLGVFDWIHFYHAAFITPIIIKMILAGTLLVVLGTGIILGKEFKLRSPIMVILFAIAFLAVAGLGYLGAGLIYGRGVAKQQPESVQKNQAGSAIFISNCQSCHPGGGNVINPDYPIKTSDKLKDKTLFIEFLRHPSLKDGSEGAMPPFSEQDINKQDADALYAYIKAMTGQG